MSHKNRDTQTTRMTRRTLLKHVGACGLMAAMSRFVPSYAWANALMPGQTSPSGFNETIIDLRIAESPFRIGKLTGTAKTINGTLPGPLIRLQEGDNVTLNVTNWLMEDTSIHWHGLLLPPNMDGVPGVSFGGIKPASTFSYRYPIRQSGTYWYHSHSGFQEQSGIYGPLIIDPIEPEPFHYDQDYIVVLSDWTFESPESVFANLKKQSGYYNFQKRAAPEFFSDVSRMGLLPALQNYLMWDRMRMDPTDLADVTGYTYTYLMNGLAPEQNWTGLFRPGERVRLRFIAATAMTFYDVRLPGLTMTVVQADGQNVQPVVVEEFRIGPAETYDVIVQPTEDRAYTIFAETMDRSGYARGTLTPRAGMTAPLPDRRPRPLRTMAAMGMTMEGMDMADMKKPDHHGVTHLEPPGMNEPTKHATATIHDTHDMSDLPPDELRQSKIPGSTPVRHPPGHHGSGNQIGRRVFASTPD